jgi:hypothetical protein
MAHRQFAMSMFATKEDLYKAKALYFQGVTEKLEELCNEFFSGGLIQPYAGANRECFYCGATEQRDGSVDHSTVDCPIIKYKIILGT